MSWPPSFLRLRIRGRRRGFGLWLPLFIIGHPSPCWQLPYPRW